MGGASGTPISWAEGRCCADAQEHETLAKSLAHEVATDEVKTVKSVGGLSSHSHHHLVLPTRSSKDMFADFPEKRAVFEVISPYMRELLKGRCVTIILEVPEATPFAKRMTATLRVNAHGDLVRCEAGEVKGTVTFPVANIVEIYVLQDDGASAFSQLVLDCLQDGEAPCLLRVVFAKVDGELSSLYILEESPVSMKSFLESFGVLSAGAPPLARQLTRRGANIMGRRKRAGSSDTGSVNSNLSSTLAKVDEGDSAAPGAVATRGADMPQATATLAQAESPVAEGVPEPQAPQPAA
mmetsp:Transcript_44378/g.128289  ORF Transcript_44378/g.128289 Transcript_44378/m.128289 type:complete len:296 (+) Transcript_44378:37-924(+)